MNRHEISPLDKSMRCMLKFTVFALLMLPFAAPMCRAQALQKGISVELAHTHNALPMPDADNEDSLVVTVADNGSVYLGVDPIDPDSLAEGIRARLASEKKHLYIKADGRSRYADLVQVLQKGQMAGAELVVLLTAQPKPAKPAAWIHPQGLEVRVGAPPASSQAPMVVTALNSGHRWPTLEINDARTSWVTLQDALAQSLRNLDPRVVVIKADAALPFAQVVHLVDVCMAAGATGVWLTREP